MASSNVSKKATTVTFAIITSLLIMLSVVGKDAMASPSVGDPSDTSGLTDLELQVQAQLTAIAPASIRIDRVELGCKPLAGATLKPLTPGLVQFASEAFMVELQQGDRSAYCSAQMAASHRVLVATHVIQAGETVTTADFQPQWIDAFGGSMGALSDFPDRGPYISATVLRPGQPLYTNVLLRPIAVHSGDLIMVQVKNGPVTLHAQLQAQSQASIGDNLRVVNPAGGVPVVVTVTGPRNAELVIQ